MVRKVIEVANGSYRELIGGKIGVGGSVLI